MMFEAVLNYGLFFGPIVLSLFIWKWFNRDPRREKMPPGPSGWPLLGYYTLLPEDWTIFSFTMAKKYGPMVYVNMAGVDTIFINDFDLVKEAFSKDNFTERPKRESFFSLFYPTGLLDWSGPLWKDQRRFSLKCLRDLGFGKKHGEEKVNSELEHFVDYIEAAGEKGKHPVTLEVPLGTCFSNLVSLILGGERYDFQTPTREKLNDVILRSNSIAGQRPIFGLCTYFPTVSKILAIIKPDSSPGHMKKLRLGTATHISSVVEKIMNDKNLETDSFVYSYLKHMNENPEEKFFSVENLKGCALSFLLGGSFTTQEYMEWMLLLVAVYPKMQEKMREEIDAAFGTSTPTTSDKLKCPFVESVIAEVHRYASIVSFNLTHVAANDDYIGGYFIPKGSELIVNHLGIHYNENYFPDPKSFKPDRFMKDGKYVKSEYLIPFGYGKRACPGEVMAQMEIFCFTTRLIQKYNILLPEGVKVDLEETVCNFFSRAPKNPSSIIFQQRI